jgi:hypothetical protein
MILILVLNQIHGYTSPDNYLEIYNQEKTNGTKFNNKGVFVPEIANAQSGPYIAPLLVTEHGLSFSQVLDASSYPKQGTSAHWEGFMKMGEIHGFVTAVGYGRILQYRRNASGGFSWQEVARYVSDDCLPGSNDSVKAVIVHDKVVIARQGRVPYGHTGTTGCQERFGNYRAMILQVFQFDASGGHIHSDAQTIYLKNDGRAREFELAVSSDRVFILIPGTTLLAFDYKKSIIGGLTASKEGGNGNVYYLCHGPDLKPDLGLGATPDVWPQQENVGQLGRTTSVCETLERVLASRKHPYLYALRATVDTGINVYELVRIGHYQSHWESGCRSCIFTDNQFRESDSKSFFNDAYYEVDPATGQGRWYYVEDAGYHSFPRSLWFQIVDQYTAPDGSLFFAAGYISEGGDRCIIRMVIANFYINPTNGRISKASTYWIGNKNRINNNYNLEFNTCTDDPNEGQWRLNGGSFAEIPYNNGNGVKVLFGFTFCLADRLSAPIGFADYINAKRVVNCKPRSITVKDLDTPGNNPQYFTFHDNRIHRLLQMDLVKDPTSGNWNAVRRTADWDYNGPGGRDATNLFWYSREYAQSGVGVDVPVDTIYYSLTHRALFTANDNTEHIGPPRGGGWPVPNPVDRRGIWRADIRFAIDECYTVGMNSSQMTPANPSVTITFSGTTTKPNANAQIDLLHPTLDHVVLASQSGVATISGNDFFTFSRTFDYTSIASNEYIVNGSINSLRVRFKLPGITTYATESSCQTNLGIVPFSKPKVTQARIENCVFPAATNAFDLRFRMDVQASNVPNATVSKIVVVLFPGGSSHPYGGSTLPFDNNYGSPNTSMLPQPYIPVASDQSFQQNALGVSVHSVSFSGGNNASLLFTVRFDPGNFQSPTVDSLNRFLNQRNFFYVAYVKDSTGRVIETSSDSKWKESITLNELSMYDYCNRDGGSSGGGPGGGSGGGPLKVSTTGGDVGFYVTNIPKVYIGSPARSVNMNIGTRPFLSDYLIEGLLNCNTYRNASVTNWCYPRSSLGSVINLSQFDVLQNIPRNEIKNISLTSNSIVLNLSSIETRYRAVVITSNSGLGTSVNVFINDDVDSLDRNFIVVCDTQVTCNMTVGRISEAVLSQSPPILNRVFYQAYTPHKLQQRRMYVNKKGDIILGNFRDRSSISVYNGAMLASGYIVTSNSYRTNIVRGLVYSRGIVASGNTTNNSLSNINFRDFVNPILHIDYDPRYVLWYGDLFVTSSSRVPRTVVGL